MLKSDPPEDLFDVERLGRHLEVLSSPTRLRILSSLRSPKRAGDLHVPASRSGGGLMKERVLSRPAILQHLQVLEGARLVERRENPEGVRFVVNQQELFRTVGELGLLASIRPTVPVDVDHTVPRDEPGLPRLPSGPKLVNVSGPQHGLSFPLEGSGPWLVGRDIESDVKLDHDPHVSRRHAVVRRETDGAFVFEVMSEAKNPVSVNLRELAPGGRTTLLAGALVSMGASVLVFQVV